MILMMALSLASAGSLQFNWSPATAEVVYTIDGSRQQPFGKLQFQRTVHYDAEIVRTEDAVELRRSGWEVQEQSTVPESVGGLEIQAWVDDLQARVPVLRLEPDGDYAGIDGGDALRQEAATDFDGAKLDPGLRQALDAMMGDASLGAMAADWWAFTGALWRKQSDQPGSSFQHTNRAPIPALGGELDLVVKFEVVGPAECAAESGCIELRATSEPNAEQLAALLGAMGQEAGILQQSFTLITEPHTLRPHQLTIGRTLKGRGADEQVRRSWTWTWSEPATAH